MDGLSEGEWIFTEDIKEQGTTVPKSLIGKRVELGSSLILVMCNTARRKQG